MTSDAPSSDDAPEGPPLPEGPLVPADAVRLLLTTVTPGKARTLATALVEEGLAACVNLVPGVRSIYRWKGGLQDDPETLLLIKAPHEGLRALARRIVELHPYEVPELLAFSPTSGLRPYLDWVVDSGNGP